MYEVEVKARLKNPEKVIKKLQEFGCAFSHELHQIDQIFIPEGIEFPPPYDTPVLRIRKENKKYFFTLKISQTSRQDCIERELEISDGKKMIEIMAFMKHKRVPIVDKKRIKGKISGIEVCIDRVKGLGNFIEAEKIVRTNNGETRQKTQQELKNFLKKIGVQEPDFVDNGKYDIMLYEKSIKS